MAIALLLLFCSVPSSLAVLTGAIIIPHGDFAYDPTLLTTPAAAVAAAEEVATASRIAAGALEREAAPDVVLLSTPHGIKLGKDFGIFMGKSGSGTTTIGDDTYDPATPKYNISASIELAPDLASDLLSTLKSRNQNVSGIYGYDDERPTPLQWGEIIPLSIMADASIKPKEGRRYIIWSNPERRYDHGPEMVPELIRIGKLIKRWAEKRPERIAVVISGDMSHTHEAKGPYGYSNASAPFDDAIGNWASSPVLCGEEASRYLLETATNLQDRALSCGFTGFVMLHGMLCAAPFSPDKYIHGRVLANRNATYYGMMAATFMYGTNGDVKTLSN